MRRLLACVIILVSVTSARAQNMIAFFSADGTLTADWGKITRCAERPYPKYDDTLKAHQLGDALFRQISSCRLMLSARHAGWVAAGGGEDPFPPARMTREDDFETPLRCNTSKLGSSEVVSCEGYEP